jgi:hypothetical protein
MKKVNDLNQMVQKAIATPEGRAALRTIFKPHMRKRTRLGEVSREAIAQLKHLDGARS